MEWGNFSSTMVTSDRLYCHITIQMSSVVIAWLQLHVDDGRPINKPIRMSYYEGLMVSA